MTAAAATFCRAAALALLLVACSGPSPRPTAGRMNADVTRLGAVVPVLEGLRATDFEQRPGCRLLAYIRGSYGEGEAGCMRQDTVAFDWLARGDQARLALAIEASGVDTDRLLAATYRPDGSIETASFVLNGAPFKEFWEYLYDPGNARPKQDVPGDRGFVRITDDWWFAWSADD